MPAHKPQRSGESATARQDQQAQYTSANQARDEFLSWCIANGVGVPTLNPDGWVRTNIPGKKPSNNSLAVIQKPDCILAYDHAQGESYLFPSARTVGRGAAAESAGGI